jgi:hypothetical protein
MYFCGTYRKIIIMANKTQMLLDLTVVDKLIVKLTNLKEFEHESLMRYDDVDLQTYLSIAIDYHETMMIIKDLRDQKMNHIVEQLKNN